MYSNGYWINKQKVPSDLNKAINYLKGLESRGEADGNVYKRLSILTQDTSPVISYEYRAKAIARGCIWDEGLTRSSRVRILELKRFQEMEQLGNTGIPLLRTLEAMVAHKVQANGKGSQHWARIHVEYLDKLIALGNWYGYYTKYHLYLQGSTHIPRDLKIAQDVFDEAERLGLLTALWCRDVAKMHWYV